MEISAKDFSARGNYQNMILCMSWILPRVGRSIFGGAASKKHRSPSHRRWRWWLFAGGVLAPVLLVATPPATAQGGPETAGNHLLRPGQDLDHVAKQYLGDRKKRRALEKANRHLQSLEPGTRVLVDLRGGLPPEAALVRRLAGRVDAQPSPIPWLRGRLFDLLLAGDGLRTFPAASVELFFPDTSRLLLTEESLIFLRDAASPHPAAAPAEIEIIDGQADLRGGESHQPHDDSLEIILGEAQVRARTDGAGELAARARRQEDGEGQVMVYRGQGEIEAAGSTVHVAAGQGSVVPRQGRPTPPESLLPAPYLVAPLPGETVAQVPTFGWNPVEGAAHYTFELCRDADCAELVHRATGLRATTHGVRALSPGRYFWRVTATAASRLDGFPSTSTVLHLEPPSATPTGATPTQPTALTGAAAATAATPTEAAPWVARDEIVVRPSRVSLLNQDPNAPLALDKEDILALPHLADDLFRALPLLPGTIGNDISAQFHIRGGRRDEAMILLDGQELYTPYHLKDLDNALSIIAPSTLANVELTTGGFPVEHGDRMGGILDMTTLTPSGRRTWLGLSLLSLQAGASGTLPNAKGNWLATARRGSIKAASKLFGGENPRLWDAFAKGSYSLGLRQTLTVHLLHSDDSLRLEERDGVEFKTRNTQQDSTTLWVKHQALLSSSLFVDTLASWSEVNSRRQALELEEEHDFDVLDQRSFNAVELRQDWDAQVGPKHLLSWGAGFRRFAAPFDYFSFRDFKTPLAIIRAEPKDGIFLFKARFVGEDLGAYFSDRLRWGERVTLEVGARYDRHSLLHESVVSPRLNLAYSVGAASVLRAAWGRFAQSQRPYELAVEDAETTFSPAETSDQFLLGFEHVFAPGSPLGDGVLRIEAYQRTIDNPRPRSESLYEPFNTFPELEPDRVRLTPLRSRSEGVEIFLRGSPHKKLRWWLNYAYAATEDRLVENGAERWVPRRIDQPHTLNLNVDLSLGQHWRLNMAWRLHTGWPTTPLSLVEVSEEDAEPSADYPFVPVLGPLNSDRLSTYHRLDLRASRNFPLRKGALTFFVDIQNVYNRENLSGFDFTLDEETGILLPVEERWPGFFPSVGLRWEF